MTIVRLRSLTVKQAVHAAVAAFVIGLAVTAAESVWAVLRERARLAERTAEIVALAEGAATTAARNRDPVQAEQVLDGLMTVRLVRAASIRVGGDRPGREEILAGRNRTPAPENTPVHEVAAWLFADLVTVEHGLLPVAGPRVAGVLRVEMDTARAADGFLSYAEAGLAVGTARNLLIGLAVALVFHRFLTRPLVRIGREVARIDPDQPGDAPITVPPGHADDELGYLVARFNGTLEQLSREHRELRRLATRCTLTGLANRALLLDRLDHAIELAHRSSHRLAVLFIDMDRFKHVNDSLGHALGDELLRQVAESLSGGLRRCDTVGRMGGDEFLIILERVDDAAEVATVAERVLRRMARPTTIRGHQINVSASIGIALFPDDGADGQGLMQRADAAMYAAKAEGGAQFVFYRNEMTERAMVRLRIEASLREATELRAFELFYQPKTEAATGRLGGFEALIRWRHNGTLIPPMDFIPVAEDSGLIVAIGDWVLDEACRTLSRWERNRCAVPVAINVSARQLMDPSFVDRVADRLAHYGTSPDLLELEITETVVMQDVRTHLPTLERLRELGVKIAIDDFGTGYSSLAYLRRLPVDVLKIDRSFVMDLPDEPAIASTVIALARQLDLATVAEGVETEAQLTWLADAGCDLIQGFLISRPVPLDAAEAMLERSELQGEAA